MPYQVKLEKFEGPLDILLQLIENQNLDIVEVSLANVADQYLHFMDENQDIPPENMVDFLFVATKLLLIKSRLLLPKLEQDEEESSLADQLKIYKEFLEASKIIENLIEQRNFLYWPKVSPLKIETVFSPPKTVGKDTLSVLFENVLKSLEPIVVLPETMLGKTATMKEKIMQIRGVLKVRDKISFNDLLSKSKNRAEIVVIFLALLELLKQKHITVQQENSFDNIYIEKLDGAHEEEEEEESIL